MQNCLFIQNKIAGRAKTFTFPFVAGHHFYLLFFKPAGSTLMFSKKIYL